jgi:hypothetical protein
MSRNSRSRPGGVANVDSQCQNGAIAVGHPLECHRRDIALQRHRRLDDAVRAAVIAVGQGQQLLADAVSRP